MKPPKKESCKYRVKTHNTTVAMKSLGLTVVFLGGNRQVAVKKH